MTAGRLIVLFAALCSTASLLHAETNWPQWRGQAGTGHSDVKRLPVEFSDDDVAWRTEIEGVGQSSPIVWEDRVFLTTASGDGAKRYVLAVDKISGKLLWQTEAPWSGSPEELHKLNCYASATCATDGERVVAFFGRGGLHCFDMDGKRLWTRDLGPFDGPWGTAASPVIVGDLVVQNCDAENDAFLLGVNKETGKTVYQTPRPKLRGWCTPILIDTGKRKELVLNGERGVNAYDPATGKDLWFARQDSGRGTPTIAPYKDLLISVNGRAGDMIAVRPGGSETVNDTHEVWRTRRSAGRDLPSPIVVGDYLFVTSMAGVGACYDPATGEELDTARLGGNYCASPIAAGRADLHSE